MTPKLCVFASLLVLDGCCLGATVSSGTGEFTDSTSTGGRGQTNGASTGSGATGGAETGTSTGAGSGTTSGTGAATGSLTASPNPIDFGYVPLLSTTIGCTTVSNSSAGSIAIQGIGSFETAGGSFQLSATDDSHPPKPFSFPITIGGGASAQICFNFTCPITQQYAGAATLLTTDPSGQDPIVQMSGWCGGPQISCAPLTLDFRVASGESAMLPVTCTNIGTSIPGFSLTIGPLNADGPFSAAFDPIINPYPVGGLLPGQGVQIDVTYTPVDQSHDFGVLAIPNNGGQGQTPYISLSGEG